MDYLEINDFPIMAKALLPCYHRHCINRPERLVKKGSTTLIREENQYGK